MKDKVIKLFNNEDDKLAHQQVIEEMEALVEQTKADKSVVNFAHVVVSTNDHIGYGYCNHYMSITMLGAFSLLSSIISTSYNEDD